MTSATSVTRLRLVQGDDPDLSAGLDACPFCEGKWPPLRSHDEVGPTVVCQGCGAVGPVCQTQEEADAAWNRRSARGAL
mgnify:CR=1 FL=1